MNVQRWGMVGVIALTIAAMLAGTTGEQQPQESLDVTISVLGLRHAPGSNGKIANLTLLIGADQQHVDKWCDAIASAVDGTPSGIIEHVVVDGKNAVIGRPPPDPGARVNAFPLRSKEQVSDHMGWQIKLCEMTTFVDDLPAAFNECIVTLKDSESIEKTFSFLWRDGDVPKFNIKVVKRSAKTTGCPVPHQIPAK